MNLSEFTLSNKPIIFLDFFSKIVSIPASKCQELGASIILPRNDQEHEDETLMSGKANIDDEKPMRRYPRLNIYYATSTSTSTSYTGTSTLATLDCTPTSYSLSAC